MPTKRKKSVAELDLKSRARAFTDVSIRTLAGIAENGTQEAARVSSAIALLDRGWGKPMQPTENKIEGSVEIILRDIAAEYAKKKQLP